MPAKFAVIFEQAGANLLPGCTPDATESQGQYEFSIASREVDLTGAREISILRTVVLPLHLKVSGKVLPSVGGAHESDGHLFPRRRGAQGQRCAVVLGEKHGQAFVIANPASVVVAAVGQVRREQRVEVIVGEIALQRFEADLLQHHVAVGIGEDFFVDSVAPAQISVLVSSNAGTPGSNGLFSKRTVPLLLGKESPAIGDDEAEIARASLVHPRKIHFIDNSVT